MEIMDSGVLIIGSGLAGLRAALEVSRMGKQTLLVSKSSIGKANNTYLAGGTINVAHGEFPLEVHMKKTFKSGRALNNPILVKILVTEAPQMVEELRHIGMSGGFQSSGFNTRKSYLIGGSEINAVLVRACRESGVKFMEGVVITDLIVRDGSCFGAVGFHKRRGDLFGFRSGTVLLATGGAGGIYAKHDNAPGMTGDGYVLGMEAGLELIDMEFVQFYPLVYASSGKVRMVIPVPFGDLGKITNRRGEDIKAKYALHEKPIAELLRDRLCQALFKEMRQGNSVNGSLFLDLRDTDPALMPGTDLFKARFKKLLSYDIKPVEIAPACHHMMGGIVIDAVGRTTIRNLFAAGEVVGGIHGANRMGGNALTEALVFGTIAGRSAADGPGTRLASHDFEDRVRSVAENRFPVSLSKGVRPTRASSLMAKLGEILWEKVGIIRTAQSLAEALQEIDRILKDVEELHTEIPREHARIIGLKNSALTGRAIAASALERTESRGAHYREDFPLEDEHWIKNIHVSLVEGLPEVTRILPLITP